eukprot:77610-Amphidinium_carterae.2
MASPLATRCMHSTSLTCYKRSRCDAEALCEAVQWNRVEFDSFLCELGLHMVRISEDLNRFRARSTDRKIRNIRAWKKSLLKGTKPVKAL